MTFKKLSDVLSAHPMLADYPYTARYILLFGNDELMTIPWHCRSHKDAEKVYKKCVEKGVTWKELYNATKDNQKGDEL